jgi:hypothetical protein
MVYMISGIPYGVTTTDFRAKALKILGQCTGGKWDIIGTMVRVDGEPHKVEKAITYLNACLHTMHPDLTELSFIEI